MMTQYWINEGGLCDGRRILVRGLGRTHNQDIFLRFVTTKLDEDLSPHEGFMSLGPQVKEE